MPTSDPSPHDSLVWLLTLSKTLLSTRELDRLLELVVKTFIEATEAERGFLLLMNKDGDLVNVHGATRSGELLAGEESRVSSLAAQVAKDGVPIFSTDTEHDTRMDARKSIVELGLRMIVCVPLNGPSGIVGVIYADGKTTLSKVFTLTNQRSLEALGDHAAAAIENARLFEDATRDPESGLLHSQYFSSQLPELARGGDAWLALLDLDDLQGVGARLGPTAAKQVVLSVAHSLRAQIQRPEIGGRLNESMFGICLRGREAEVRQRLCDIQKRNHKARAGEIDVDVRVSIGCVRISGRPEDARRRAEAALSQARLEPQSLFIA